MTRYKTSISLFGLLACLGPAALAQSDGDQGYCDLGYVMADTNEDGMVNPAEHNVAMQSEFSDLDADGDGTISMDEYTSCRSAWTEASNVRQTLGEDDMAMLDRNDDGEISQEEFTSATQDAIEARWGPNPPEQKVEVMESAMDSDTESADTEDTADASSSGDMNTGSDTDMATDQETGSDQGSDGSDSAEASTTAGTEDAQQDAMNQAASDMIGRILVVTPGMTMTQDDFAARAAQAFILIDRDQNRSIEANEWTATDRSPQQIRDRARAEFSAMDTDASGDVSREEYESESMRRWDARQSDSGADSEADSGDGSGANADANTQADAQDASSGDDVGQPVVLYRYPEPM